MPPIDPIPEAPSAGDLAAYQPETLGFFFSPRGRVNRKHFWANGMLSLLLSPLLFVLLGVAADVTWLPSLGILVAACSSLMLVARRTHDFGVSGWWSSVLFLSLTLIALALMRRGVAPQWALLNPILLLLVLGLIPGDKNANRFGAPLCDGPQTQEAV